MEDSRTPMFTRAGKSLATFLDGGPKKEKLDMERYTTKDGHKIRKLFNWMDTIILFTKQKLIYQ